MSSPFSSPVRFLVVCFVVSLCAESTRAQLPVAEAQELTVDGERDIVRDRYPNGRVRIEREVKQDEAENYVNDGPWKMFDPHGNVIAVGQYDRDLRTGTWSRWYLSRDAKLLAAMPYRQFHGPLLSQAVFQDGELNGHWTISDSKQHKISQWQFVQGRRHGTCTWWYPNGRKMREATYREGELDGQLSEWNPQGALIKHEHYQQGRRLITKTEHYKNGGKKSETGYLEARLALRSRDDWWSATPATYVVEGKVEKHGPSITWWENGQMKRQGVHEHGVPTGKIVWWYPNGQKSLEGVYFQGDQDGRWTWWHANGQKMIAGVFSRGEPSDRWLWWQENGKVAQRADFSDADQSLIAQPERPNPDAPLQATLPELKSILK